MTTRKLVQNFGLGRAHLVADPTFPRETLERTLARLGMSLSDAGVIDPDEIDAGRDVILLDGDLPSAPPLPSAHGSSMPVVPVIGLVGAEAPSRLRMLVEAGATSFLRKPVSPAAVYSALFFGVNLHRRLSVTEERLASHERRRHQRRFVTRAVMTLARRHGLSDDEAYVALRRDSMRLRLSVEDYCERFFGPGAESLAATNGPPIAETDTSEKGTTDATIFDVERGVGDVDDRDVGQRRRTDQARRA